MIAQGALAGAPIYIDDTPGIKITEIRARSRKLSQEVEGGLSLIVIDYLQLITGRRPENRQQEVSDISRQLILAKGLKVPVIALSQFYLVGSNNVRINVQSCLIFESQDLSSRMPIL